MPVRESRPASDGVPVSSLRRCSSAHQRRSAGPQELVRTVSQRLRGLIGAVTARTDGAETVSSGNRGNGSDGRLEHDQCGGAKAKIIDTSPWLVHEEEPGIHGHTCKLRLSLAPVQGFKLPATGTRPGLEEQRIFNDWGERSIGGDVEEERIVTSPRSPGCFRMMRSSSRGKSSSSSLSQDLAISGGGSRKFCRGCFGSTMFPEELPDSSGSFGENDLDLHHQQQQPQQQSCVLPDEVLEMFLAMLPFDSLVRARAVCKKWRDLTQSSHFLQLRDKIGSPRPWLFLLGLSRDGVSLGQIQALDPSVDRWHSIRAEPLARRLLYSVASIGSTLFVVGGCSARPSSDREKGGILKTHRSVLVLDAFGGQWSKAGSGMRTARTTPVVAVFEMTEAIRLKLFAAPDKIKPGRTRKRSAEIGVFRGSSFSSSSKLMDIMGRRSQRSPGTLTSSYSFHVVDQVATNLGSSSSSSKPRSSSSSYGLIVIGGQDERNQTLYSGEVYDSVSGSWSRGVASWPCTEFGSLCTGVVSKGILYCYSDSDKLVALDIERNSWYGISVPSSGIPSRIQDYLPKLVACNGKILLTGVAWASRSANGFDQQQQQQHQPKAARKIWRLDDHDHRLMSWRWTEVSQHPDAPLDWNAVFIGHGERVFGVEMFKIFGQVLDFVTVCEFPTLRRKRPSWDRVSKHRMGKDVDSSSCLTKTAVIVQL